jgi:hypothetical protein
VSPDSLDILFAKDPYILTDADVDAIVERLEADRLKFLAAPEGEPKRERGKRADLGKKIELPTDLSADDILSEIGL